MNQPRKIETKTCPRCGGSGEYSYCQAYGTRCFKCHGRKVVLTRRGEQSNAYLIRLRSRTLAEIKPGMLVFDEPGPFSKGGFKKVESISELKEAGRFKSGGDTEWTVRYGHDLNLEGMTLGGLSMDTVKRVGHTALGKTETLRIALDFQDRLTKTGSMRKDSTFPTAEEILATTNTAGWLVQQ